MHKRHPTTTILQVLPAFESGGVERVTLDTALGLSKKSEVRILVASQGGKLAKNLAEYSGAGTFHITLPLHSKNPFRILWNALTLRRVLRAHQVDLVHVRSRAPAHSVRLSCWLTGIPFIGTCHGAYGVENPLKCWYNSALMRGRAVIAISAFIERYIQKHYATFKPNIRVIHEGIDTTFFDPTRYTLADFQNIRAAWRVNDDQTVILLPGRLTRGKGHLLALEALLSCHDYRLKLIILGSGQAKTVYPNALKARVENDSFLKAQVVFVENATDIPLAYAASDLVLSIGTKPEAFGRVAVEAGAMERVVIGANHGATPELIDDERWLIAPGSVEDLVVKIKDFMTLSEDEKAIIGAAARQGVITHFSVDTMLKKTWALYQEIIENSQKLPKTEISV